MFVEPDKLTWAQRADLLDLFEASDLTFRVDVVEAEGLTASVAERVSAEGVCLSELTIGR